MRRYEVFRVGLKIAPVGELFFTRLYDLLYR